MATRIVRWLALAAFCRLIRPAEAAGLSVETTCNTYTGIAGSDGIAQFLGIRFAAPPVGELRFMPPEDPNCDDTVQLSDHTHGKICFPTGGDPADTDNSEDCLFLDIYTPANVTSHSKLPVYFFIQGGGFNSLSNPNYNGKGLIKAADFDLVVVTFNYRVGPYGFITNGDEITPNNGLLDQRKALEWVQKYISFFGGDPDHVVLGGDSAGAASISLQLTAYGGEDAGLFHAAAAESVSFATVLTVDESQYQYDDLAAAAGCDGDNSLDCLRNLTTAELQSVNTGSPYPGAPSAPIYPWNPVIDGDLIRNLTYEAFADGHFIKLPFIVGDDTNEGTTFTPRDTSSLNESEAFLQSNFPYLTETQLDGISELYPNKNTSCPASGCYWRQVSDAYGDLRYTCPGLYVTTAMTDYGVPQTYSYRYNVEDPDQVAEGLGVPHTVEVNAIWGPENVLNAPASYFPGGINAPVVPIIQAYWTSFIRSFDPNKYRAPYAARWETWNPDKENRLLFETGGKTKMEVVDDAMRKKCDYFYSIGVAIRQ
ncbi:vacuolar triacylglycerol lipase [Astrocystis sublimbata]|nr:vacuolar triacylglycerol lipase [Astrocystis sublimbata]